MSIVPGGMRQLGEVGTIGTYREDIVSVCAACFTCESDAVTQWRPRGEVVVSRRELGVLAVVQVQYLEAAFVFRPHAKDDARWNAESW